MLQDQPAGVGGGQLKKCIFGAIFMQYGDSDDYVFNNVKCLAWHSVRKTLRHKNGSIPPHSSSNPAVQLPQSMPDSRRTFNLLKHRAMSLRLSQMAHVNTPQAGLPRPLATDHIMVLTWRLGRAANVPEQKHRTGKDALIHNYTHTQAKTKQQNNDQWNNTLVTSS